ncbi:hypothetical protein [Nocardia sp. IFM 10818]
MSRRLWLVVAMITAAVAVGGCDTRKEWSRSAPTTTTRPVTTTIKPTTTTTTPPPLLNRRGENGQIFVQSGLVGSGTLRVINDDAKDVAVVVTNDDPKNPQATMYVQANSEATINGISGTYSVYLKTGTDWDEATLSFTRNRGFEKFDDPFDEWTIWSLGLKPTPDGNATTSDVPAF